MDGRLKEARRDYICAELDALGVVRRGPIWPLVLDELEYSLFPWVHEGKVAPYGSIIAADADPEVYLKCDAEITLGNLALNREAADGHSTFVWRGPDAATSSVIGFERARFDHEVSIYTLRDDRLRRRPDPRGSPSADDTGVFKAPVGIDDFFVLQRLRGTVRLLCAPGVVLVRDSVWSLHPYQYDFLLDDYVESSHRSEADVATLALVARHISRFAVHLLSPERIGATLLWLFEPCDPARLSLANRIDLPVGSSRRESLNIGAEHSKTRTRQWFLASILAQHDGATIIQRDGTAVAVNVFINLPTRQGEPPSHGATRQRSAREGSRGLDGVIVTVSSDGPVRAYADGELQLSTSPSDEPTFNGRGGDAPGAPPTPVAP